MMDCSLMKKPCAMVVPGGLLFVLVAGWTGCEPAPPTPDAGLADGGRPTDSADAEVPEIDGGLLDSGAFDAGSSACITTPVFSEGALLYRNAVLRMSSPTAISVPDDGEVCLTIATHTNGRGLACDAGIDCAVDPMNRACAIGADQLQGNERARFYLVDADDRRIDLGESDDCNGLDERCADCGPYTWCANAPAGTYDLVAEHVDLVMEEGETPESVRILPGSVQVCPVCVPMEEVCDGVDNDCDGVVDEITEPCGTECGSGTKTCIDGDWGACEADPGTPLPEPEVCDGVDNDCDGVVDEITRSCAADCGSGTQTCTDGAWGECDADPGTPAPRPEVCDGVDNDCDGIIDEGLTRSCNECGPGTQTCGGGDWGECELNSVRRHSIELTMSGDDRVTAWADGTPLGGATFLPGRVLRFELPSGCHTLAFHVEDLAAQVSGFLAGVKIDGVLTHQTGDRSFRRSAVRPPAAQWRAVGFDDSTWPTPTACSAPHDLWDDWPPNAALMSGGARWVAHSSDCRALNENFYRLNLVLP